MTRPAFDDLVKLCAGYINTHSIHPITATIRQTNVRLSKRKHGTRDIVAMGLKYLLSCASTKDLHIQFGAVLQTYLDMVQLALESFIRCVGESEIGSVHWDLSIANMERCALRTQGFLIYQTL